MDRGRMLSVMGDCNQLHLQVTCSLPAAKASCPQIWRPYYSSWQIVRVPAANRYNSSLENPFCKRRRVTGLWTSGFVLWVLKGSFRIPSGVERVLNWLLSAMIWSQFTTQHDQWGRVQKVTIAPPQGTNHSFTLACSLLWGCPTFHMTPSCIPALGQTA